MSYTEQEFYGFFGKVLCFFDLHKWEHSFYLSGKYAASGDRCVRCRTWHKDADKVELSQERKV